MAVKKYEESDDVRKARELAESMQKPEPYVSQYGSAMDDAMEKVINRKPFQYDMTSDPTYLQYRDSYMRDGQKAAIDTAARASANTGGYGNSYAQSVSQQAYGDYMARLADKIPELRQLAMEAYDREGDNLARNLSILQDRESQDYGRYRDSVSDYERDRDYATDRYDTERGFDYQKDRDSVADQKWQEEFDESKRRYDQEWDYEMEKANASHGGGSGSGSRKDESEEPAEEQKKKETKYNEALGDCTALQKKGASYNVIVNLITDYLDEGAITQAEANALRAKFKPAPTANRLNVGVRD